MSIDLVFAFGLGLLIGSFVNVLILRLPRMLVAQLQNSTTETPRYDLCWPASHCPHCKQPLRIWHNMPLLSYVALKGRCAFCRHPIGWLYPTVELVTAFVWLMCAWHWGFNATGMCWALFASLLLAMSVIDWQTTLLPDDLTQALVWSGLLASTMNWIALPTWESIWGAAIGYVSLWSVAYAFKRVTGKPGMGAGDFKLLAGLGAWLGPVALIPLLVLASLSGALVGIGLKLAKRLAPEGYIAFGPFLAVAGVWVAAVDPKHMATWLGWRLIA